MEKDIIKHGSNIHAIVKGMQGGALSKPFTQDIFLLNTHIAGTGYYKLDKIAENLIFDAHLQLKREPQNEHDCYAVAVLCNATKVGYIPAEKNEIISHLMDAGKIIFAKINANDQNYPWVEILVDVYFKEI